MKVSEKKWCSLLHLLKMRLAIIIRLWTVTMIHKGWCEDDLLFQRIS